LKRAYPSEIQPESTTSNTGYKSLEYRFLEALKSAQNLAGQTDIDRYFHNPTISTGFDANQSQTDYIRDWGGRSIRSNLTAWLTYQLQK
jgi:hypothetical protein